MSKIVHLNFLKFKCASTTVYLINSNDIQTKDCHCDLSLFHQICLGIHIILICVTNPISYSVLFDKILLVNLSVQGRYCIFH